MIFMMILIFKRFQLINQTIMTFKRHIATQKNSFTTIRVAAQIRILTICQIIVAFDILL